MSQPPLTDRNGVVCYRCFKTIDLTETSTQKTQNRQGWVRAMLGSTSTFYPIGITCPYCQSKVKYDYNEIRPIAPSWENQKQVYESRISLLRAQKDRALADAKRLAELAHQEYPTEDFEEPDSPSAVPPSSVEPKLEKKKDERLPYLG